MLQLRGAVFARLQNICGLGTCISPELLPVLKHVLDVPNCSTLADNDVITVYNRTRINDTIVVQLVVGTKPDILCLSKVRSLEDLVFLLRVRVSPEEGRSEESTVDTRLITNYGVLLIIAGIAGDGDNSIAASWQLLEVKKLHRSSADQWLLRIVKDVGHGVHPN